jgi:hypothetical protein
VGEQRYKAAMAVHSGGRTIKAAAMDWDLSRLMPHTGLARYEGKGREGMSDRSHQPNQYHSQCLKQPRRPLEVLRLGLLDAALRRGQPESNHLAVVSRRDRKLTSRRWSNNHSSQRPQ